MNIRSEMSVSLTKENKTMRKLNLGCGAQVPTGWTNVDYAIGARVAKIPFFRTMNRRFRLFDLDWHDGIYLHDLRKPFPWEGGSIDVVYTSHTLEHFSKEDGLSFLRECHRVLRPSGIIRVVVPDLAQLVQQYADRKIPADEFIDHLGVSYRHGGCWLKRRLSLFMQFPDHKCMYDAETLLHVLRGIGFDAGVREPFDSDIEDIGQVEIEDRTKDAVIVEGRKL